MTHPEHPAAGRTGLTVVGCGYTGRRLLQFCRQAGRDCVGTARGDDSLAQIRARGGRALQLDLDLPAARLPAEHCAGRGLVYMAPPPQAGATDPRLRNLLAALPAAPATLVYLSTTAVYGDTGGAVVSEDTAAAPASDRGRRRLDAERAALQWSDATGVPVRILRVPGIYGPGRLPIERIRQGAPVARAEDAGPGNRIHVDDLAGACLAAVDYAGAERIFNLGDGDHASMTEYFHAVADAAGLARPPELPLQDLLAKVSPAMRGFLQESRRVDTTRMRTALGYTPRYASLAAGITASLAQDAP